MPELKPDKELCNLAKEEIKNFSEHSNYNKYQIGKEFKSKLRDKFSQNEVGLIALDEIKIWKNYFHNKVDENKKGRNILINKEFDHIGINESIADEEISIIIIFSKIKPKEK